MYIHILTNKLSREALKSGLLWISLQQYEHEQLLQGLWITKDLTANLFAVHGQANAEEKAISCAEKLVLELTRAIPLVFLFLCHKASVIETFPRALLMGALANAFKYPCWWQPESWWQGDKAKLAKVEGLNYQLRNKQFCFPREATEYETCIKPLGIPFWI